MPVLYLHCSTRFRRDTTEQLYAGIMRLPVPIHSRHFCLHTRDSLLRVEQIIDATTSLRQCYNYTAGTTRRRSRMIRIITLVQVDWYAKPITRSSSRHLFAPEVHFRRDKRRNKRGTTSRQGTAAKLCEVAASWSRELTVLETGVARALWLARCVERLSPPAVRYSKKHSYSTG